MMRKIQVLFLKSHVRAHDRRLRSGRVIHISAHDDSRRPGGSNPGHGKTSLKQEYEETRARYVGTPQWLKAPNGQPSNLNERQWVLVRTPRFKAWFGDWESAHHQSFLMSKPVALLTGAEFPKSDTPLTERVADWFDTEFGGKAMHPILGAVVLNERGVKDSIAHGLGRIKSVAFAAVPDIIRQGHIIDVEKNWKGKPYDGYTLAAPVRIGQKDYVGVVIVHRDANQRFYLQEVILRDALQPEPFKTEALTGRSAALNGGHAGAIARLLRNIFAVKGEGVSKAVDENGEPMVVFHGTNADISRFDLDKSPEGFYFSDSTDMANAFGGSIGGNVMSVYLNVKNPADFGISQKVLRAADDVRSEVPKQLSNLGFDAIRIPTVTGDTTWIVFNSANIKSAIGNNGAFSPDDNTITKSIPTAVRITRR